MRTSPGIISAESGVAGCARPLNHRGWIRWARRHSAPQLSGQAIGVLVPASRGQEFSSGSATGAINYAVKNKYVRQLRVRLNPDLASVGSTSESIEFVREQDAVPPL